MNHSDGAAHWIGVEAFGRCSHPDLSITANARKFSDVLMVNVAETVKWINRSLELTCIWSLFLDVGYVFK